MLDSDKVISFIPSALAVKNRSKDPSTQVGAIVLDPEYGIVAQGWNGLPRKVNDNVSARYERPLKYKWIVHAEMNAIANAARRGIALRDCEMLVVNHIICSQCCAMAIQSGIKRIVCAKYNPHIEAHVRLKEDYEIAKQMMFEAGISHVEYS